jgi:branched-chain amino acid aminotransferase
MKSIHILNHEQTLARIQENFQSHPQYKAMYSSLLDGIITNSQLMVIPIDDHMVHRGDGVFEAFKSYNRAIYDLDAHLERLKYSASCLSLKIPKTSEEIKHICCELARASGLNDIVFRLYVSRGPGSFTPNPYESQGSQLYIIATESKTFTEEYFLKGVSVGFSELGTRTQPYCRIKSCNYLLNVLMKKESVNKDFNFCVSFDSHGFLAEGPTENIAIINDKNELVAPLYDNMLKGTTLQRSLELAREFKSELGFTAVLQKNISKEEVLKAKEAFMVGTTLSILPIREIEGQPLNQYHSESLSIRLRKKLEHDIHNNAKLRLLY